MQYPFECGPAKTLNTDIFVTLYFAACDASCELAAIRGPYETYAGRWARVVSKVDRFVAILRRHRRISEGRHSTVSPS